MRVDIEFYDLCKDMGVGTKTTRKLAKEKTILSEMIQNDEFVQNIREIYKDL